MRSGTIEVSGGMLETGWWGPAATEAPTLVLLHEGLGSVALWRDVPERLAASTGCGVFAYSRFGYGNSDAVTLPRPMTYMHHEAQVVLPEVLRAAGIKRAVLIGHSDGGSIAAIYAGLRGDAATCSSPSLAGLAASGELGGSGPGHHSGRDTLFGAAGSDDPHPTLLGLVTIAAHFFVEDLNIVSIRKIKADYESGSLRARLARYHRDVDTAFRGWNDAWLDPRFRAFDITHLLCNIRVPVLGLQGEVDPYGTAEQLHVLKANVQAPIMIRLIPGAQHSPHLEARDATLAAIVGFIATLQRDTST